jgi:hypothetical protein
MAGSKSNFLQNAVLNHVLGGATYTPPADVYFALYTTAPTDSTAGVEVTGGSYARVQKTNNTTTFPTTTTSTKKNGVVITWPKATASWGDVRGWAILDVSSNILFWSGVTTKTVDANDTVSIDVDGMVITED